MSWLNEKVKTFDTWKGFIAVGAAVVMYFSPDYVDRIIELLLVTAGVPMIVLSNKKS